MATSAIDASDRSISIGRIFSRAFSTIGNNPAATLGVALIFGALPTIAVSFVSQNLRPEVTSPSDSFGTAYLATAFLTIILSVVFSMITQGALVRATIAESEDRKASFAECALTGLKLVLPLFALGIITGLGVLVASILLLVPGIILYLIWSVAAPALVAEGRGVFEALGRSRALTKGARLKIFGIELVMIVIVWLLLIGLGILALVFFGGVQGMMTTALQGLAIGYAILNAVVQTLIAAIWGTVQTSLYIDLRDWKDGPGAEALADVFA